MTAKKTLIIGLTGLAAIVIAVPVFALDSGHKDRMDKMGSMKGHGQQMMNRVDIDEDGIISAEEFAGIGVGHLLEADSDGDGELSMDEIRTAMEARHKAQMERMFLRRFDVDGDGKITLAELKERQDKRFALLDADNDGSLSADEFRKARREFGRMGRDHGKHRDWMKHHGDRDD